MRSTAIAVSLAVVLGCVGCATTPRAPQRDGALLVAGQAIELFDQGDFEDLADLFHYPLRYNRRINREIKASLVGRLEKFHRQLGPTQGEPTPFDGMNAVTLHISAAQRATWKKLEAEGGRFERSDVLVEYTDAGEGCLKLTLYWAGKDWEIQQMEFGFLLSRESLDGMLAPFEEFLEGDG